MAEKTNALCSEKMVAKINAYIKAWESRGYENGIPDEAPESLERINAVPSYRMIVRAILKNDVQLTTLGYEREPCAMYSKLKREELKANGKIKVLAVQYGLFGGEYECI